MVGRGFAAGGDPAPGILKVTRHPMMWAFGLWALAHIAANGDLRSLLLFGSMAVLALYGTVRLDAKRRAQNLPAQPSADPLVWLRRVTLDLTGLPPTRVEMEVFAAACGVPLARLEAPAATGGTNSAFRIPHSAFESVVERLLASPHYGERWARHWLDVVHFGETHGYDKDKPRPNAWPYRDYVIRALNADKPYSQFIREQIAGDVLYPGTVDGTEALGFLAYVAVEVVVIIGVLKWAGAL